MELAKIEVTITGLSPILMHNPIAMQYQKAKLGPKGAYIPGAEEEAEWGAYRRDNKLCLDDELKCNADKNNDGAELIVPSHWLQSGSIVAASGYKINKKAAIPLVAGSTEVLPDKIGLGRWEYDIDTRSVVIQRSRVMRSRPLITLPWEVTFDIHFDPEWVHPLFAEDGLQQIYERLGKAVGLGDYRPAKKGKFGKFEITRWAVLASTLRKVS